MNKLKVILSTGTIVPYKTKCTTALSALYEWKDKLKELGFYDIEEFVKIRNAALLDEDGATVDLLYDPDVFPDAETFL